MQSEELEFAELKRQEKSEGTDRESAVESISEGKVPIILKIFCNFVKNLKA